MPGRQTSNRSSRAARTLGRAASTSRARRPLRGRRGNFPPEMLRNLNAMLTFSVGRRSARAAPLIKLRRIPMVASERSSSAAAETRRTAPAASTSAFCAPASRASRCCWPGRWALWPPARRRGVRPASSAGPARSASRRHRPPPLRPRLVGEPRRPAGRRVAQRCGGRPGDATRRGQQGPGRHPAPNRLVGAAGVLSTETGGIKGEANRLNQRGGFFRPTNGELGSKFGPRMHPILHYTRLHAGWDNLGGNCGQPIWAARDGKVVLAAQAGQSGNYLRIDHGTVNGTKVETSYQHMQSFTVKAGDTVSAGRSSATSATPGSRPPATCTSASSPLGERRPEYQYLEG